MYGHAVSSSSRRNGRHRLDDLPHLPPWEEGGTQKQEGKSSLYSIPHLHTYGAPSNPEQAHLAMEEYTCLLHYLTQAYQHLLSMAESGKPFRVGIPPQSKDIPLKLHHGFQHEIVTIEGEFGQIHVLLPKPTQR